MLNFNPAWVGGPASAGSTDKNVLNASLSSEVTHPWAGPFCPPVTQFITRLTDAGRRLRAHLAARSIVLQRENSMPAKGTSNPWMSSEEL